MHVILVDREADKKVVYLLFFSDSINRMNDDGWPHGRDIWSKTTSSLDDRHMLMMKYFVPNVFIIIL